jgi:hypothetical protein
MASSKHDRFDTRARPTDAYTDYAKRGIFVESAKDNEAKDAKFEYNDVVNKLDKEKKNEVYRRELFRKSILEKVQGRCEILHRVLRKRPLTVDEKQQKREYIKAADEGKITSEQEAKLEELLELELNPANIGEIEAKQIFKNIEKCYPIKNASFELLKPNYTNYNNEVIYNVEPEVKTDKRISIRIKDTANLTEEITKFVEKMKRPPCIIIPGSRMQPGGEYLQGRNGFEELFYFRTTISLAINNTVINGFYPLVDDTVIMIPDIKFIFDSEEKDYKSLSKDNPIPVISGIIYTPVQFDASDEVKFNIEKQKIRNAISTALFFGHQHIMTSSMGCEQGLTPESIVKLLDDVLFNEEDKFYYRIKTFTMLVKNNKFDCNSYFVANLQGKQFAV